MSTTTIGRVLSAGGEHAASAPGFLLRGGGVIAVALAAGFGTYVLVADHLPEGSADASHEELSAAHEPNSAAPGSLKPDSAPTLTKAAKQETVAASPREDRLDSPRLVPTERFDGDPSVWANVRKFLPWPADQVPVLDIVPPAQPPTAAPAALDSPKAIGVPHGKPTRADRHRHNSVRTHASARSSQTQANGGAPVDVGGTRMTAVELQRGGSKNPLVNAFSSIVGPN
jgi:hypothetical protein